jgi:hypothetical protein
MPWKSSAWWRQFAAGSPMSWRVTTAGTGLARSVTRSIVPDPMRSSRNHVVSASIDGRRRATAGGTR